MIGVLLSLATGGIGKILSFAKGVPWYLWAIAALGLVVCWESHGKAKAEKEVAALRADLKASEDGKKIDEQSIITLTDAQRVSNATIDDFAAKAAKATQAAAQATTEADKASQGRDALSRALKAAQSGSNDVDAPAEHMRARGAL